MKILPKIYRENLNYRSESIEIGISEYGIFYPDPIINKVVGYNK